MGRSDLNKGRTRPKRKSVKSKAPLSSKRKLSRMGKERKKGHEGEAVIFISRSQALKKLQLPLRDFRCAPRSLGACWTVAADDRRGASPVARAAAGCAS